MYDIVYRVREDLPLSNGRAAAAGTKGAFSRGAKGAFSRGAFSRGAFSRGAKGAGCADRCPDGHADRYADARVAIVVTATAASTA